MSITHITVLRYTCDRCGHSWIPRVPAGEFPKFCPRCKRAEWNTRIIKQPV